MYMYMYMYMTICMMEILEVFNQNTILAPNVLPGKAYMLMD